jgi:arylsulfatase A-like enzyme
MLDGAGIWEGGTRGTALIWSGSATGLIQQKFVGSPVEALMHGIDWLPTICKVRWSTL